MKSSETPCNLFNHVSNIVDFAQLFVVCCLLLLVLFFLFDFLVPLYVSGSLFRKQTIRFCPQCVQTELNTAIEPIPDLILDGVQDAKDVHACCMEHNMFIQHRFYRGAGSEKTIVTPRVQSLHAP
eukprot:6485640-Amphidinium_carterae.1